VTTQPIRSTSEVGIDKHALEASAQTIRRELMQRVVPDSCSQASALDEVLELVFGGQRSAVERLQFLVFAAPIARRLVLQRAATESRALDRDVTVVGVCELFHWCDSFDPLSARMLDLYYFAGLSIKQTALALDVNWTAVIRALRFGKIWLGIKLGVLE
jgi:hypothetical protein